MVARVIVGVRDLGVEHHPAKQLGQILRRVRAAPAQLIGQQEVGPFGSITVRVLGAQGRQGADHAVAQVAARPSGAVEALHQQHVLAGHGFDAVARYAQPALLGQCQHRAFYACIAPGIVRLGKLGQPQTLLVLDDVLGPGAAHGRARAAEARASAVAPRLAGGVAGHEALGRHEQGFQLNHRIEPIFLC